MWQGEAGDKVEKVAHVALWLVVIVLVSKVRVTVRCQLTLHLMLIFVVHPSGLGMEHKEAGGMV